MNTTKTSQRSPLKVLWILAIWVLIAAMPQQADAQIKADYLNYDKMTSQLKRLSSSNQEVMKLQSIGQTTAGKEIWLVTLAAQGDQAVDQRPAILISANLEGNQVAGTELSVRMIEKLVADYRHNEQVKILLEKHTVYFLPRINPDGAEKYLADVSTLTRTNNTPYDGDNDGRLDEDGPDDLNQDGLITLMRVADPEGKYFVDPDNPQLLKVADPTKGESGVYKVYWEGLDNDGDGFINEDPLGGTDINRNFAHEYPYYQPDAGIHMVSENETRAVMDWVITHRNVAIMLTFCESDNLLNAPDNRGHLKTDREMSMFSFADASNAEADKTGMVRSRSYMGYYMRGYMRSGSQSQNTGSQRSGRQGRTAATTYNKDDLTYFSKVSDLYKETTGIKTAPPMRNPKGAFSEYGYFQYGVLSLSNPGWGLPAVEDTAQPAGEGRRSGRQMQGRQMPGRSMPGGFGGGPASTGGGVEAELLKYMKDHDVDGFVPWTTYQHPDLGEVEIGGFKAFESFNPQMELIEEMAIKQTDFVVKLADLFPKVEILKTEVIDHGDGLFGIKAMVTNTGFLPTSLQQGVDARAVKPTMVQLGVDPDQIISGNDKTNFIRKLDGSGKTQSYEWLVKGKKGDKLTLKVVAQKAGNDQKTIELQ